LGNAKKTKVENSLFEIRRPNFDLPVLDEHKYEDSYDEMDLLGFSLCSPFDLLKEELPSRLKAVEIDQFLGKQISIVGYLVTIKNTRTSKKTLMQFGTFVDFEGNWIDTVHFPPSVARFPFRGKGCYLLKGKVVEEFGYHTVEVGFMERLDYVNRDENNVPKKRPSKKKVG
jgi:DNA polymerase-3 subunit alpha